MLPVHERLDALQTAWSIFFMVFGGVLQLEGIAWTQPIFDANRSSQRFERFLTWLIAFSFDFLFFVCSFFGARIWPCNACFRLLRGHRSKVALEPCVAPSSDLMCLVDAIFGAVSAGPMFHMFQNVVLLQNCS